ncbi:MAG: hypothetical protein QNJ53_11415 [Pleurocapsa sp. MO_192.B19]|nr:hypothetical protein [Pleurocapsa sp. MO_192.B19]
MIGLRPNNHVGYLKLARVLKQQNKIYGAIAAYAEAIKLKSDLPARVYKDFLFLADSKASTWNNRASIKHEGGIYCLPERGFHRFKRGHLPALPLYFQDECRNCEKAQQLSLIYNLRDYTRQV